MAIDPAAPSPGPANSAELHGVNPVSQWDAADYTSVGSFVAANGDIILQSLAVIPGERVLDVGCGDGSLTARLRDLGAEVVGLDPSEALVAHARSRQLDVIQGDVLRMGFDQEFDAIFSNAALHWVLDAPGAARAMFRALRPGGRIAVEFGGFGNIAAIRVALRVALGEAGYTTLPQDQFYPTARQYAAILQAAGFRDVACEIVPRPTPLRDGLESWLRTFRGGLMNVLGIPVATRDQIFARTAELLAPSLLDPEGQWWADYVRIRAWAVRPAPEPEQQYQQADQSGPAPAPEGPPPEADPDSALFASPDADGRWHVLPPAEDQQAEMAPVDQPVDVGQLPPPTGPPLAGPYPPPYAPPAPVQPPPVQQPPVQQPPVQQLPPTFPPPRG